MKRDAEFYSASLFVQLAVYSQNFIKNVTIWARVQSALGLKVVALVPLVMPLATAHWTGPE